MNNAEVNTLVVRRWLLPVAASAILLTVLLLVFPFASGYTTSNKPLGQVLWSTWTNTDTGGQDYSYCLLVPILVAYLIYARSGFVARAPQRPVAWALVWTVLALALFWLGSRAGKQYLGAAGIQVLLAGLILWFWGRGAFRVLGFTWIFLLFIWPLPFMDSLVALPMRILVSRLAGEILNLSGIHTIRDGTALFSAPNQTAGLSAGDLFQIDIADPCSGLHSLFPLLMFSAIYSYLFLPRPWQQWTVFLGAFPLIVVGNVARIILLVLGCLHWGMAVAIGTDDKPSSYHENCGFAVFVIVLGLELALAWLLVRLDRRSVEPAEKPAGPVTAEAPEMWRSGVILGLAALMLVIYFATPNRYLPQESGVVMELPSTLSVPSLSSPLYGRKAEVSKAELTLLPKDTQFCRKYFDDLRGHEFFFSIVLSGLQQYTIHPPEVCLRAQGWTIDQRGDVPVHLPSGHTLMVRNLHLSRKVVGPDGQFHPLEALYLYWYVTDGMTTPSQIQRNLWSSWDRIMNNRDHRWAYISAMSASTQGQTSDGQSEAQTLALLQDFIATMAPQILKTEGAAGVAE